MPSSHHLQINDTRFHFLTHGDGPALLLVHAGVADARMWHPLMDLLGGTFHTIAPDLRGYGWSELRPGPYAHHDDLAGLLEHLGIESAGVVGNSFGGKVALEFGVTHPSRVSWIGALAPPLPGWDWSDEVRAFSDAEDAAIEAGDLDAAVRANVEMWCVGPKRSSNDVPNDFKDHVATMQRRAFEVQIEGEKIEPPPEEGAIEDLTARLSGLRMPTFVAVGDRDVDDFISIAEHAAATIPGAEHAVVRDAGHLLPSEQPNEVARLISDFAARTVS
jgi:pimeloyl-ACP methyl ester carboxylesterase